MISLYSLVCICPAVQLYLGVLGWNLLFCSASAGRFWSVTRALRCYRMMNTNELCVAVSGLGEDAKHC